MSILRPSLLVAGLVVMSILFAGPAAAGGPPPAAADSNRSGGPVGGFDANLMPSVYGIFSWASTYVTFAEDIQKVGIQWVAAGGWNDQAATDQATLTAAKNGVHLAPYLSMKKNVLLEEGGLGKWGAYVRASALRYGPGGALWKEHPAIVARPIRHWLIWDEPETGTLTSPEGVSKIDFYAKVLQIAATELRGVDPQAKIVAFNTAGATPTAEPSPDAHLAEQDYYGFRRFIREVVAKVDTGCFDYVGIHPITPPLGPEYSGQIRGLELLREIPAIRGKPVWYTSGGYPLTYPGKKQVRDERQQACFLVRNYAIASAHCVVQADPAYPTDFVQESLRSFGFFVKPGQWREQAYAAKVMIRLLPDPRKNCRTLSEEREPFKDGVFAYQFEGVNGWPTIMAWWTGKDGFPEACRERLTKRGIMTKPWRQGDETVEREFAFEGRTATLVDMLGKEVRPLDIKDGKVKVTLSEAPVYIVPAGKEDVQRLLGP